MVLIYWVIISWATTLCSLLGNYQPFGETSGSISKNFLRRGIPLKTTVYLHGHDKFTVYGF
jgi:hypothetical protein